MKTLLLVLVTAFIQILFSYTWIPFGDFQEPIYNIDFFLDELDIIVVAGEDTLYVQQDDIWQIANTHRLTTWDTEIYDEDQLLLVMGGYSNSDGLYMLYLDDLNDNVIEWMQVPRFIHFNNYDNRYYLGASPGIGLSPDAYNWTGIPSFEQSAFYRIANYNTNYLITTSSGVYHKEFTNPPVFRAQPDPGEIENDELNEISGITASVKNNGIFWAINDSGGDNAVYGFNENGEHVAKIYLQGVENRDWEDITISRSTQQIFVADIGDNGHVYDTKYIYRFEEPWLNLEELPLIDTVNVATIAFQYPTGNYDAETLMCDPEYQGLYIVTKRSSESPGGEDLVFKLPFPQSTNEVIMAEDVGSISVPAWYYSGDEMYYGATAGAISTVGDEMIIKTYSDIFYWKKQPGQTIDELFAQDFETVEYLQEPQGEAVCWDKYGTDYYTVSEEPVSIIPAVLKKYKRDDWKTSQDSLEIVDVCFNSAGTCYGRSNAQDSVSYLYISEDFGESWELLTDSPYGYLGALVIDSQGNLFAGWRGYNNEPSGVALWDGASGEFIFLNEGIEGKSINKLLQFPLLETPSVIACTDSGAYFLTDYTDTDQTEIIPPCTELKVFPNPALLSENNVRNNIITTIQYEISVEGHVSVVVYNIKGRKVKTLIDKGMSGGRHQTGWDGLDENGNAVGSGIYFCRVTVKGNSSYSRIVVIRS